MKNVKIFLVIMVTLATSETANVDEYFRCVRWNYYRILREKLQKVQIIIHLPIHGRLVSCS